MINVILTTKNWRSNYNSRTMEFKDEFEMDEYIANMFEDQFFEKLINITHL